MREFVPTSENVKLINIEVLTDKELVIKIA